MRQQRTRKTIKKSFGARTVAVAQTQSAPPTGGALLKSIYT